MDWAITTLVRSATAGQQLPQHEQHEEPSAAVAAGAKRGQADPPKAATAKRARTTSAATEPALDRDATVAKPAWEVGYWTLLGELLAPTGREADDAGADDALGVSTALRTPLVGAWATVAAAPPADDAPAVIAAMHHVYLLLRDRHGALARTTLEQAVTLAAALLNAVATQRDPATTAALVAFAISALDDLQRLQHHQPVARKVFSLFCARLLCKIAPTTTRARTPHVPAAARTPDSVRFAPIRTFCPAPVLTVVTQAAGEAALLERAHTLIRDSLFHPDVLAEFNLAITAAHPVAASGKPGKPGRPTAVAAAGASTSSLFSFQKQLFDALAALLAQPPANVSADALARTAWPLLLRQFRAALDGRVRGAHALASTLGYAAFDQAHPSGRRGPHDGLAAAGWTRRAAQ